MYTYTVMNNRLASVSPDRLYFQVRATNKSLEFFSYVRMRAYIHRNALDCYSNAVFYLLCCGESNIACIAIHFLILFLGSENSAIIMLVF